MTVNRLSAICPTLVPERGLSATIRTGMDRYWASFARFAALRRGGIVIGGDMA